MNDLDEIRVDLVLDLSDEVLEQVLQCHDPLGSAVLVEHHRHLAALGLHLLQCVEHADRLGRRRQLVRDATDLTVATTDEIAEVDETDEVVRFAPVGAIYPIVVVDLRVSGTRIGWCPVCFTVCLSRLWCSLSVRDVPRTLRWSCSVTSSPCCNLRRSRRGSQQMSIPRSVDTSIRSCLCLRIGNLGVVAPRCTRRSSGGTRLVLCSMRNARLLM